MLKKHIYKTRTFLPTPKDTHNPLFILKTTFKSNNSYKNHHMLAICIKNHHILTICILTILIKTTTQTIL